MSNTHQNNSSTENHSFGGHTESHRKRYHQATRYGYNEFNNRVYPCFNSNYLPSSLHSQSEVRLVIS